MVTVAGASLAFSTAPVGERLADFGVVSAVFVGGAFGGVLGPRLLGDMASVVFVESAKGVTLESVQPAKRVMLEVVEDVVGCPGD